MFGFVVWNCIHLFHIAIPAPPEAFIPRLKIGFLNEHNVQLEKAIVFFPYALLVIIPMSLR